MVGKAMSPAVLLLLSTLAPTAESVTTGAILAAGNNQYSMLGDGTSSHRHRPVPVTVLGTNNSAVSAGGFHTLYLKANGAVFAVGLNEFGQLGDRTSTHRQSPVHVSALGTDNMAVSAGFEHSVYLKKSGAVFASGLNDNGQIGDGSTAHRSSPVQITTLNMDNMAVSAGGRHTVYLKKSGEIYAAGRNYFGQLADATTVHRLTPVRIYALGANNSAIAAGYEHTCYLKVVGEAFCSGWNTAGQLGDRTSTNRVVPVQVAFEPKLTSVSSISAGYIHTVFLTASGAIYATGWNAYGQIGDGTTGDRHSPVVVTSSGLDSAAISAGGYHTLFLKQGGEVFAAGRNSDGQLGVGTASARCIHPLQISALGSDNAAVVAGNLHTVYLKKNQVCSAGARSCSPGAAGHELLSASSVATCARPLCADVDYVDGGSCCPEAICPVGSVGTGVAAGCTMLAGYAGDLAATNEPSTAFVTTVPLRVRCPPNTVGEYVVDGCRCDSSRWFTGMVMPIVEPPHFNSTCVERTEPLTVQLLGSPGRVVGREDTLELAAHASWHDVALYSWNCATTLGALLANRSAASGAAGAMWTVAAANLESTTICTVAVTVDEARATAATRVEVEAGSKMHIVITAPASRVVNPSQRLRLHGAVPNLDILTYSWAAGSMTNNSANSSEPILQPFSPDTTTGFESPYLVVAPDQLLPGQRYRFMLTVTSSMLTGSTSVDISTNSPPQGGTIAVVPESGRAVTDTFAIATTGWSDEDQPLTYRFGSVLASAAAKTYVTDFSVSGRALTVLPAGLPADHSMVSVVVEARDNLGAIAAPISTDVTVHRFVPPTDVPLSSFAADLVRQSDGIDAAGQIVGSLAATLNEGGSVPMDADEVVAVREVLVNAMLASAATIDSSSVARAGQIMAAVTSKPEQMSQMATDKALEFALSLTGTLESGNPEAEVDVGALGSMVGITSNLVQASMQNYWHSESQRRLSTSNSSQFDANRQRTAQFSTVINSVGTTLARDCVPGEPERTLTTDSFDLTVVSGKPGPGSKLRGGKVIVPELPGTNGLANVKVIAWSGAGPLAWATKTKSNATLQSSLLSVSFGNPDGSEISLSALSEPFTVVLDIKYDKNSSIVDGFGFSCSHWNVNLSEWVPDGVLKAQTESNITCEFSHLTDFGSLFGPSNELASVDELFSLSAWADNILGLVLVLSILFLAVALVLYSFCAHLRGLQKHGRVVKADLISTSAYAMQLLVVGYKSKKKRFCKVCKNRACFTFRAKTVCGSLFCHFGGDPYTRPQRILLVFLTMLSAFYFNVLLFAPEMEPICSNSTASPISTCKSFRCPSCYEVYGNSDCNSAQQVAPLDLCMRYVPSLKFSAHDACETRPFEACRIGSGDSLQFIDPDPESGACVDKYATFVRMLSNYTRAGRDEAIDTACYNYEPGLKETVMTAVLTVLCTWPILTLLELCFGSFRKRKCATMFHVSGNTIFGNMSRCNPLLIILTVNLVILTVNDEKRGGGGGIDSAYNVYPD